MNSMTRGQMLQTWKTVTANNQLFYKSTKTQQRKPKQMKRNKTKTKATACDNGAGNGLSFLLYKHRFVFTC